MRVSGLRALKPRLQTQPLQPVPTSSSSQQLINPSPSQTGAPRQQLDTPAAHAEPPAASLGTDSPEHDRPTPVDHVSESGSEPSQGVGIDDHASHSSPHLARRGATAKQVPEGDAAPSHASPSLLRRVGPAQQGEAMPEESAGTDPVSPLAEADALDNWAASVQASPSQFLSGGLPRPAMMVLDSAPASDVGNNAQEACISQPVPAVAQLDSPKIAEASFSCGASGSVMKGLREPAIDQAVALPAQGRRVEQGAQGPVAAGPASPQVRSAVALAQRLGSGEDMDRPDATSPVSPSTRAEAALALEPGATEHPDAARPASDSVQAEAVLAQKAEVLERPDAFKPDANTPASAFAWAEAALALEPGGTEHPDAAHLAPQSAQAGAALVSRPALGGGMQQADEEVRDPASAQAINNLALENATNALGMEQAAAIRADATPSRAAPLAQTPGDVKEPPAVVSDAMPAEPAPAVPNPDLVGFSQSLPPRLVRCDEGQWICFARRSDYIPMAEWPDGGSIGHSCREH